MWRFEKDRDRAARELRKHQELAHRDRYRGEIKSRDNDEWCTCKNAVGRYRKTKGRGCPKGLRCHACKWTKIIKEPTIRELRLRSRWEDERLLLYG